MMKIVLGGIAGIFSFVGGFIVDGDFLSLMCFLIVALCFVFIGVIGAIEAVGGRIAK